MIAVFIIIYAIVGLRPSIDYITGNGRITFYTIYAIASTLVLIGTLYFTYEFAETETYFPLLRAMLARNEFRRVEYERALKAGGANGEEAETQEAV